MSETNTKLIKIGNCIITYNYVFNSLCFRSIKLEKRINKDFNENEITTIDTGSRLNNAAIIRALSDQVITFNQVINEDVSELMNIIIEHTNKKINQDITPPDDDDCEEIQ